MKKIILGLVVLVMIATPCLAEVEPEGLFSLNGTVWNMCLVGFVSIPPFVTGSCNFLSFYQGKMYECNDESGTYCELRDNSSYIDLGVGSIVWGIIEPYAFELAIMQPIGLGIYTTGGVGCGMYCAAFYGIGIMNKVNDNWKPTDADMM